MDSLSGSGQAGIGIRDSTLQVRVLRLASALASASLAGLAGAGTTGDLIGITTVYFSSTTATYPTAESSSIVTTLIARVRAAGFMAEPASAAGALRGVGVLVEPQSRSIRLRHRMTSPRPILARSAALIMEEPPAAFPHAGSRASVEASIEAGAFTVAALVTVAEDSGRDLFHPYKGNLRHGERN